MFWGLPTETWAAIAGLASAFAAVLLVVIGICSVVVNRKIRKASEDYVQATKEIIGITHNPIVAVEVRTPGFGPEDREQAPMHYKLSNIGNSPAVQIYYSYGVSLDGQEIFKLDPLHFVPFIRTAESRDWVIISFKELVEDYQTKIDRKLFPTNNQYGFREYEGAIRYYIWFKNHIGHCYKSAISTCYTFKLDSRGFILVEERLGYEGFDYERIEEKEFLAAIGVG